MLFPNEILIRVAICALAALGFWVARKIYRHKRSQERAPLVCFAGFDCHAVVHSDYSKFFGIPVELLGMGYYAVVSISYLFLIFVPGILPLVLVNFLIAMSAIAFLFSIYLIFVQIFILKKGCSWCIVSAIISSLIFKLTIATYHLSYVIDIFT